MAHPAELSRSHSHSFDPGNQQSIDDARTLDLDDLEPVGDVELPVGLDSQESDEYADVEESLPSVAYSISGESSSDCPESKKTSHKDFKAHILAAIAIRLKKGLYQGEEKQRVQKIFSVIEKIRASSFLTEVIEQAKVLSKRVTHLDNQDRTIERTFIKLSDECKSPTQNPLIKESEKEEFAKIRELVFTHLFDHKAFKKNILNQISVRRKKGMYKGLEKSVQRVYKSLQKIEPSPDLTKACQQVEKLAPRLTRLKTEERTFERTLLHLIEDMDRPESERLIKPKERWEFVEIQEIIIKEIFDHKAFKNEVVEKISTRISEGFYQGEEEAQIKKLVKILKRIEPDPVVTEAFRQVDQLSMRILPFGGDKDRTFERTLLQLKNDLNQQPDKRLIQISEKRRFAAIRHLLDKHFQQIASKRVPSQLTQLFLKKEEKEKRISDPTNQRLEEALLLSDDHMVLKIFHGRGVFLQDLIEDSLYLAVDRENNALFKLLLDRFKDITLKWMKDAFREFMMLRQLEKIQFTLIHLSSEKLFHERNGFFIGKLAVEASEKPHLEKIVAFLLALIHVIYDLDLTALIENLAERGDTENLITAISFDSERVIPCGDALLKACKHNHTEIVGAIWEKYNKEIKEKEESELVDALIVIAQNGYSASLEKLGDLSFLEEEQLKDLKIIAEKHGHASLFESDNDDQERKFQAVDRQSSRASGRKVAIVPYTSPAQSPRAKAAKKK